MNLLPEKSKKIYLKAYDDYKKWLLLKSASTSENVMLAYMAEKSTVAKPSTLWSVYLMLKATLSVRDDTDIGKYRKVTAFLKRKADGYKPKKSKILNREQIEKFMKEAPNETFLMMNIIILCVCPRRLRAVHFHIFIVCGLFPFLIHHKSKFDILLNVKKVKSPRA